MELENILKNPFFAYQIYKYKDIENETIVFFNGSSYLLPEKQVLIDMIKLIENTVEVYDEAKNISLKLNGIIKDNPTNKETQKVKKRASGFIYLLYCNANKLYKIGSSKNVIDRIKYLKTANPSIEFINSYPVESMLIEKEIHEQYKNKRVSGEWFDLSLVDVEKIFESLKNNPK